VHPPLECLGTACTDCLKIYWRYGGGTTTAIWIAPELLTLSSGSKQRTLWWSAWSASNSFTEPPLNNWSAIEMRCLWSDAFKILALLEFGCTVAYKSTPFKLMGWRWCQTPKPPLPLWAHSSHLHSFLCPHFWARCVMLVTYRYRLSVIVY